MRYLIVLAVTAATALSIAPAQSQESAREGWCTNQSVEAHLDRAKTIIKKAYANDRWRDSTPATQSEKDSWRKHTLCLGDYGTKRVHNYKDAREQHFEQYRAERLSQAAEARYTPYDCGSHGSYAIPCYIVACESGYSWGAYNSSGAAGVYQIMPEHGRPWPANTAEARAAHHRIAYNLYNGGAGASNWVCA